MNNTYTEESGSLLNKSIATTAKVAAIAAIISITGTIAGVIIFFFSAAPAALPTEGFDNATAQAANSAPYISVFISLFIGILTFYFLYRFSVLAKKSFVKNDRSVLTTALYSLAAYFRVWAIIMVLILIFFALALIGGVLSTAMQ